MLNFDYKVLEELDIGETQWRLVENTHNKKRGIQLWSTLSKQWNMSYRYDVDEAWESWKETAKKLKNTKLVVYE